MITLRKGSRHHPQYIVFLLPLKLSEAGETTLSLLLNRSKSVANKSFVRIQHYPRREHVEPINQTFINFMWK